MRVFLTSAAKSSEGLATCALNEVKECAQLDRVGEHQLTYDPAAADLILFVETDQGIGPFGVRLRAHPLVRAMREKCFLYNSSDSPVAHLPGLYASLEKRRYDPVRTRTAHYLSTDVTIPPRKSKPMSERPLLFSFVGNAQNAEVRQRIMQLQHERGKCLDTSAQNATVWGDPVRRVRFVDEYAEMLGNTKFALCPRGCGAGSMRLFEAMRVGCVPVILADDWVPPNGPIWADFAIFVPEKELHSLPGLLESLEPDAATKGVLAQTTWDDWFSEQMSFHRLVEWCLELKRARTLSEQQRDTSRWVTLSEPLWPGNAVATLRWLKAWTVREFHRRTP